MVVLDGEAGDAKQIASEEQEKDEPKPPTLLSLEIFRITKDAQQQHGLRHGDYQRYRGYCSRRLRRLRKVLKIPQGDRRHYRRRDVTTNHLSAPNAEARLLCVPLLQAERAWAHAMQLRQEANTEPRKKFHLTARLKKAFAHAQTLLQLCEQSGLCDARTQLEAGAYAAWLGGALLLEVQQWRAAAESLTRAQIVLEKLCAALPEDDRIVYKQKLSLTGPAKWAEIFPEANGARQSPVDINTTCVATGRSVPPLVWSYSVNHTRSVVNPGYCWRVDENGYDSELRGGPLGCDIYKLEQWHCHWGARDGEGSEHTVDGRAFSGELHLVHWNTSKYKSFAEAAGQEDGLAVLGVLLAVGKKHDELEKVVRVLPYIQHKGDKVTMTEPVDPAKLLPARNAYWTYPGSLTTPPCTESVTWILFKDPVECSAEQLALMRKLRCGEASCGVEAMEVLHNYRPTLPLGNRELRDYGGN